MGTPLIEINLFEKRSFRMKASDQSSSVSGRVSSPSQLSAADSIAAHPSSPSGRLRPSVASNQSDDTTLGVFHSERPDPASISGRPATTALARLE
jgi:hypothetical protein